MPDDHLLTLLLGRLGGARDGSLQRLLSALWSFLQHSPALIEGHLSALEERLTGLEQDLERALNGRMSIIQARLETVKTRVVADLKRELRRLIVSMALAAGSAVMMLVGAVFGLIAVWTKLRGLIGSVGASVALAAVFFVAAAVALGLLRSFLHRSQSQDG